MINILFTFITGMLTAVVCGEVFASPSVTNILNAIVTVARPGAEILLIVKNYTGDRLNFGLAGEIAKTRYGYKVETLLVDDDCSIENVRKSVGKRGLAGTVLIHKIAGAMAESGCSLTEIHKFCSSLLTKERILTIGFTFKDCGEKGLKNIEIGRGIHGEPGVITLEDEPDFEHIIEILQEKFLKKIPRRADRINKPEVLVMFNNLGGTSCFAMSTFALHFLKHIRYNYNVRLVLEGTFMTSFNQEGISVTLVNLEDSKEEILKYLKVPAMISANVPFNIERPFTEPDDHPVARYDTEYSLDKVEYDERCYRVKYGDLGIELGKKSILGICTMLIKVEKMLNALDAEFGDGDTGTLLVNGANAVLEALNSDKLNLMYPCILLHDLAEAVQKNMGGSLGAIFCIFLEAAAEAFQMEEDVLSVTTPLSLWLLALKFGTRAVQHYGKAEVGDRTVIDALTGGIQALETTMMENVESSIKETIEDFATGCEDGADKTKNMVPLSGRAAYAFSDGKEFTSEFNDPGAHAIGIIFRAMCEAMKPVLNRNNID